MEKQELKRMQQLAGIIKEELDYSKISNVELEDVFTSDYPDFSDAYIAYAEYDGVPMTSEQLDELNNDGDFVYEEIMDKLF
jgi:hypothetical protein